MHMLLQPRATNAFVVYCRGGRVRIYQRQEWTAQREAATPIVELSESEAGALAWFLEHWLPPSVVRPGYNAGDVDAEFDL